MEARLGHFNNKDIKNFVIEYTSNLNNKDFYQCKISKLKRKPFYRSPNKTEKPQEVIHTDVVGKLETFYGFNYYITFIDDYSPKCWVYLIKNKSDAFNPFVYFHKFITNTTSYKSLI